MSNDNCCFCLFVALATSVVSATLRCFATAVQYHSSANPVGLLRFCGWGFPEEVINKCEAELDNFFWK